MDFHHRKLLSSKKNSNTNYTHVVTAESFFAYSPPAPPPIPIGARTPYVYSSPPPPPPPPSPPPQPACPPTRSDVVDPNHASKTTMMIMSFAFGGALLLAIICIVSRIYFIKRRNARRQISQAMLFATHQDFLDGDQGPGINHHIWLINTIGLQQSVIDSITTFRYKKDERLIDGTDCSVCLSEFQEGETLRLLPKCSHAFHIPCIDTWLTSRKNCPICRAPIVSDNFVAQVALPVPTRDLSSREETQMENSDNTSDSRSSNRAEDGASDVRNGDDFTIHSLLIEDAANAGNSSMNSDRSVLRNPRIRSDLVYNIELVVGAEMQPMRRSVSLDLADASEIYGLMGDAVPEKCQVNSDSLLIQPKRPKSKAHAKRGSSGNLSFHKLMKNSDRSVPRNARIPSDLVDNKHLVPEAEMQPKRRSVSFDLDNASEINGMMASVVPGKCQANSDSLLIQPKRPKSKRGSSGNLSLQKLMKSSSRGRSLQKGPVSMKRSLSTSGRSRCSDAMIQSYPSDDEILICSDGKPSVSG